MSPLDDVTSLSGAGTMIFVAHRYLAFTVLWPAAIGVLGGTGMAAVAT